MNIEKALEVEEVFWKEKSRLSWHSKGDMNIYFFHRMSKIKSTRNVITHLKDGNNLLQDPQSISNHVKNYFSNLFGVADASLDFPDMESIIPCLISDQMNNMINSSPYVEEIKKRVSTLFLTTPLALTDL